MANKSNAKFVANIEVVNIKEVHLNKANPRIIQDDKFRKLVNSIKEFPEMLHIRPIVVDACMIVIGGNMRLKACIEAGLNEIPIIRAHTLTEDQQQRFIISDNVAFGEWDWDVLKSDWDTDDLESWGLDVPNQSEEPKAKQSKPKAEYTIVLNYSQDEYDAVVESLSRIASTPEQAVLELLNKA